MTRILIYAAPAIGVGYMFLLMGLYVMKFATDVLLIAPTTMSLIFGISRLSDAFFDPLCGYLSDRTRHRWGRRRVWLALSVIPIASTFVMMFSPPLTLTSTMLSLWMGIAIVGFYATTSMFLMPHMSLGAELTDQYHDRTRLFGTRHAFWNVGSILALVTMGVLLSDQAGARATGSLVAFTTSVLVGLSILIAVIALRERREFQGVTHSTPLKAFQDVWRNGHARLLVVVTFIESIGSATIGLLTLYVAQYIVGDLGVGVYLILTYMIPSSASVPLWLPLARRVGKVRLWFYSLLLTGASFGGFFVLPFIDSFDTRLAVAFFFAFWAGIASGCGGTVAPSIQSDVIDYDEHVTGERKEGAYFSAWSFVTKSASGVVALLMGLVLDAAGYIPNVDQTMTVKLAIAGLYALLPVGCYTLAALLLRRFRFDHEAHAAVHADLIKRRAKRDAAVART